MLRTGATILLHACCAPCATYVLEQLAASYSVTVLFYNPNIYPHEEYGNRLRATEQLCALTGTRLVDSGPCAYADWQSFVAGHETDREGGARCRLCFQMRLETVAARAAADGFDAFATTLTISPHKSASVINAVGAAIAERVGVAFLEADFKKQDGFKKSCVLTRRYRLYRQHYCGCQYSMR